MTDMTIPSKMKKGAAVEGRRARHDGELPRSSHLPTIAAPDLGKPAIGSPG
ncbi:hypothetical protein [Sphingosinicella sp. BN140058]|uniref:hypothetical protein n=1 Tax=Sphingosinicella sp. BN140058 TaxID=1892855 RepID=UPI0013E9C07E|nr:hypothetical protein [Sphingosinicella sp. BN140058]